MKPLLLSNSVLMQKNCHKDTLKQSTIGILATLFAYARHAVGHEFLFILFPRFLLILCNFLQNLVSMSHFHTLIG